MRILDSDDEPFTPAVRPIVNSDILKVALDSVLWFLTWTSEDEDSPTSTSTSTRCSRPSNRGRNERLLARQWMPRIVLLVSCTCTFVQTPISIYMFWGQEFRVLWDFIISTFVYGLGITIIITLLYKEDRLNVVIEHWREMKKFGQRSQNDEGKGENHVMLESNQKHTLVLYQLVIFSSVVYLLAVLPIPHNIKARKLTFIHWFPYELAAPVNFELTYLVLAPNLVYTLQIALAFNTLLMALLLEAIVNLKLIKYNLSQVCSADRRTAHLQGLQDPPATPSEGQEINGDCNNTDSENIIVLNKYLSMEIKLGELSNERTVQRPSRITRNRMKANEEVADRLRFCVCHHQAVHRFIRKVSGSMEFYLLQQCASTIVPVILVIVFLTHEPHIDLTSLIYMGLVVGVTFHQAIFCWLADQIAQEDEAIRESVYAMDWFEGTESFKASLRIMMSRCNQPLIVRVAGFVPLNMETFYNMMKMIYTYYMSIITTIKT